MEREPYGYDRTPDNVEGLPGKLKDLRIRFRVGRLVIPRDSGCALEPLNTSMVQITTPDGEIFRVHARHVEWEE